MKVSLTKEEMIRRRRIAAGFDTLRADCTVERNDGVDVDTLLEMEARRWYLELLDKADLSKLAPEDVSDDALCVPAGDIEKLRIAVVTPPGRCRRVINLRLRGWDHAVKIHPESELDTIIKFQDNPYTAATTEFPVAVQGRFGQIYAWPATGLLPEVTEMIAVTDPGPNLYILDDSAL